MDNKDLINDLNDIESLASHINSLTASLIFKCQQTRNKLAEAGVSTLAEARLNAIAEEARRRFRERIYKKSKR